MTAYTYNKFPYGIYEISTTLLLKNNIDDTLYNDIVNLIDDYTTFLEEHIKYCNNFYITCNTNSYNKIIIECMVNSEHMDILSSTTESIMGMKNRLNNIEKLLDEKNNNYIRDILWRRYRKYKDEINMYVKYK